MLIAKLHGNRLVKTKPRTSRREEVEVPDTDMLLICWGIPLAQINAVVSLILYAAIFPFYEPQGPRALTLDRSLGAWPA